jgi:magnesium-transporting ATPase (P-type)
MSLGTGAEIANEASDIVLVKGHVADVCTALDLSRVIFRRIQWNFLWSLVYNCLGIPIAAGVAFPLIHARLPPTVAAIAMAFSSISVVCSSLALRLYRPPVIEVVSRQRPSGTDTNRQRSRRSQTRPRRRARRMRLSDGDEGLNLLENDHLDGSEATGVTEATEPTDNRTYDLMEHGDAA